MDARNKTLVPLLCAAALAGCAMQGFTPEESALAGASVRENVARQVIDPTAGQQATTTPPADARKTTAALDRYRKDDGKVKDDTLIKDVGGGEE